MSACYTIYLFFQPRANVTVEFHLLNVYVVAVVQNARARFGLQCQIMFKYPLLRQLFSAKADWEITKLETFVFQNYFKACVGMSTYSLSGSVLRLILQTKTIFFKDSSNITLVNLTCYHYVTCSMAVEQTSELA